MKKNISFQEWYEEADIPEKVNGVWVDLETGISFRSHQGPAASALPELEGTAKQISWAKSIRNSFIAQISDESVKAKFLRRVGDQAASWIEIRSRKLEELLPFI